MSTSSTRSDALAAILALSAVGCGVGEGEYVTYRVAIESISTSVGCYYPEEEPPEDEAQDSDSFLASDTLVIYFGAGDKLVLDSGVRSYRGEETGEGFVFEAQSVDVSYIGIDQQEAKLTVTTIDGVNMAVDGDAVQGSFSQRVTTSCSFLTAVPSGDVCPSPPPPDCQRTAQFFGVRLDDVELTKGVDGSQPSP